MSAGDYSLRILRGRNFAAEDRTAVPRVAIVNLPFSEKVLDGAALGRVVRVAAYQGGGYASSIEVRIVGVVEPALDPGYSRETLPAIYLP
ncbi:MAG: hypothetical protein HY646_04440 [Acidobacteria bacterium]|nr:hypothetical protein [Acidobacteriota bacterium]